MGCIQNLGLNLVLSHSSAGDEVVLLTANTKNVNKATQNFSRELTSI